jgi:hypothetical protein
MPEHPSRDDIETTSTAPRRCPVCHTPFTPIRRQRYCGETCRKTAWRRRHANPPPTITVPTARPRRDTTVYICPDCDTRYLGQQWCYDCNRPARRVGPGGLCPHCDEPVAVDDLITAPTPHTKAVTMPAD